MNSWRNCSTAVSSDGRRAKIPHNYRGRPSFTSVLFWLTRTRESTPTNANNSVLSRSILCWAEVGSNLYQPRKTIWVSEILKMNPTLSYSLSLTLKLATNQLHISSSNWCQGSHSKLKGMLVEFLSKIILIVTTFVTWRSKFSAVCLQLQCASAQL